jgi:hypothetical protein
MQPWCAKEAVEQDVFFMHQGRVSEDVGKRGVVLLQGL